jgi:hypothetical protein
MRSALALLALLTPLTAYGADTLGRLFFTPDQRAQLDALRTKRVVASQSKEEPLPEVVTFNGIVRRSDGKTTVWVNNQALSEADLRDKPAIAGRVSRDGKILLQATQPGTARTQLKVGQSAELLSGQVAESYNATTSAAARTLKPEPAKAAPTTAGKDIETPGRSAQSERAGDGTAPATTPTTRP